MLELGSDLSNMHPAAGKTQPEPTIGAVAMPQTMQIKRSVCDRLWSVATGMATTIIIAALAVAQALGPAAAQNQTSGLYDELKEFVQLDYLGMGSENHITSPTLFADRIDYYGKRQIRRDTMMRKRLAYYDKWPVRSYIMLADTFRVAERDADAVDITFNYRFEVANEDRRVGGLGRTNLTVRLDDDGGFTITRETGKVIERF
ncbi:MAG: hypothetical protein AAFU66_04280 [Pseudomonadota bacterium]